MNNLINWNNINEKSLYEQLDEKIKYHEEIDRTNIINEFESEELEEQLQYHQEDYTLYKTKLEFINKLNKDDSDKRQRHYRILIKLDQLADVDDKRKFKMMLSYGVIVAYFTETIKRTDEEMIMLSACSSSLDLDFYTDYIGILSDERLASSIVSKSSDLNDQLDMAYKVMDVQDSYKLGYVGPDNYEIFVKSGLEVVSEFEKEKER